MLPQLAGHGTSAVQSELKNLCEEEESACCASVLPLNRAVLVAPSYRYNTVLFEITVQFFLLS